MIFILSLFNLSIFVLILSDCNLPRRLLNSHNSIFQSHRPHFYSFFDTLFLFILNKSESLNRTILTLRKNHLGYSSQLTKYFLNISLSRTKRNIPYMNCKTALILFNFLRASHHHIKDSAFNPTLINFSSGILSLISAFELDITVPLRIVIVIVNQANIR